MDETAMRRLLSLLSLPAGESGLPCSAIFLLSAGFLFFSASLTLRLFRKNRRKKGEKPSGIVPGQRILPLPGLLLSFLCTALGGGLLFLFCEDRIPAVSLLLAAALGHAALLSLARRAEREDREAIDLPPEGESHEKRSSLSPKGQAAAKRSSPSDSAKGGDAF